MGNIPHLNNIQQLTNILGSINPYMGNSGQQPSQNQQIDPSQFMGNQGFGGTFFTQDANNGGYYSSNGHTINIQGPSGGNIRVAVNEDGNYYQVDPYGAENDDDLLDEFPQDLEENILDEEQYYEDENLDSDGEPLPSADEIKNIINSIPSYRFEEASNDGYESSAMSQKKSK